MNNGSMTMLGLRYFITKHLKRKRKINTTKKIIKLNLKIN